jgi:transketolase
MRTAFFDALVDLAQADKRIMLLIGDVGFGVTREYVAQVPDQFCNVGISEQNMTAMAAGMALSGRIVFTYSIGNFPTLRCLEQVRNDVCYHKANVKMVTVGGGMVYGSLGASHYATEDLAVMRAMPNLVVVAPGDPVESKLITRALVRCEGPAYLRLGRAGEPVVHDSVPRLELGKALTVREGDDLTLISTGGMLFETTQAADALRGQGIGARVLSMHTIKPLDVEAILRAAEETLAILTIEEHSVIGGLGGAVAEVLMEADRRPHIFRRIGLDGSFSSLVGDQQYLRAQHGLDAAGILAVVQSVLVAA